MPRSRTYRESINEALVQEMERDERVILMGEDIAGGQGAPGWRARSDGSNSDRQGRWR